MELASQVTSLTSSNVSYRIYYPSYHLIQNGVPQGEVRSVPFFLKAINDLTKCANFPLTQRLFADDSRNSLQSSNPQRYVKLRRKNFDKISAWVSAFSSTSQIRGNPWIDLKNILTLNPLALFPGNTDQLPQNWGSLYYRKFYVEFFSTEVLLSWEAYFP